MSSTFLLCLLLAIGGLSSAFPGRRCRFFRGHLICHFLSQSENLKCSKWMYWGKEENCAKVVERFGLKDAKELESLNDNLQCSLNPDTFEGLHMCVKQLKEGVISKAIFCDKYMVASAGDTCDLVDKKIAVEWDIAALNPEVNCEKLIEGEILCGKYFVAPICEVFHRVEKSTETCQSVVEETKLRGLATLITLNPDLDCNKPMEVGRMLCLKIVSHEDS